MSWLVNFEKQEDNGKLIALFQSLLVQINKSWRFNVKIELFWVWMEILMMINIWEMNF